MKMVLAASVLLAGTLVVTTAHANEKLAQANNCMTCHAVDKKVIGPSFKDVAAKYKGDKGAEAKLVQKVKAGGKGVWGEVVMPPNPQLKDEDAKALVSWVMSQK